MNISEYDSQAADYDQSRFTDDLGRHLDSMHKEILHDLIDPCCRKLLEAGVGTGRFATWIARSGVEVVGIDLSREMLKKAKKKTSMLNVPVALVRAEVHYLPFKEGIFDGCICVNVIDHFPDLDGFLRQVKYVVKKNGCFVFNFSNVQSVYLPIALLINSKGHAMFRGGKIQSAWVTFKDIKDMLNRNGFGIIDVKGCFIASPIPFGNALVKFIRAINFSAKNSQLRFFSGSPFVKVKIVNSEKFHQKTCLPESK
jgi:ubiquinone/menaquinone biosynthesis C-methylase UbiE